ncbi:MAG: replicative DNA helicase [Clostridiales bacterium]|nr:replicative DNA helicase [Clostridiales bacterium]
MAIQIRQLPHNIEAEQSVLGAMILDKDAIIDVVDVIGEADYFKDQHKHIHRAIINLFNHNVSIDMVTLSEELSSFVKLESIGGMEYLTELTSAGVFTSHARSYAKIIEEKAMLRKLIIATTEIAEKGYEKEDADALLEMAEQSIFDISQKKNKEGLVGISEILQETVHEIERLAANPNAITGISTGFHDIDKKTNGLHKSDLVLIAARPSMGKTAFALNVCQNAAVKEKQSVAIFSLEMAKEQLVQRMLASEALIPIQNIRTGQLKENEWGTMAKAMASLSTAKIFIDDTPGITVLEMRAKSRRLKLEHGLDLIMIDYMQLMSSHSPGESRQQEISSISRGLKALAREMDCPVVALSQLSRAPEARSDHRPILSDLRESGAIEQDADIVMFLYRDEYYHEDSEKKNIGEVIISKQRNGETGRIDLAWLGQYTKFASLQRQEG